MEPKKIILCPNPDRDTGMKATKSAIAILRDMGFQTVVCSPFRDPKTNAFGDLPSKPLLPELKGADLVITLGGDGTILHLAKLAALHKLRIEEIRAQADVDEKSERREMDGRQRREDWAFWQSWRSAL